MREARILLVPISWLYAGVVMIRNWFYDTGLFRVHTVGVPVISVGNITTGGTGKTPFVEYLVRYFLKTNRKVVVISRGYKRTTRGTHVVSDEATVHGDAETSGDEAYQIARKFPGLTVIADERRVRAANLAVSQFRPDVIVLDDGFQHRSLGRDLDIVMLDGTVQLTQTEYLPAGHRREPIASLCRADLLAVSRVESPDESLRPIGERISDLPVISVQFRPKRFTRIDSGDEMDPREMKGKRCVGFCGVGNPQSFRTTLEELGLTVAAFLIFPDHHRYDDADVSAIRKCFENGDAEMIVTTEKDSARLQSMKMSDPLPVSACYFIEIEAVIPKGENLLHDLLNKAGRGHNG